MAYNGREGGREVAESSSFWVFSLFLAHHTLKASWMDFFFLDTFPSKHLRDFMVQSRCLLKARKLWHSPRAHFQSDEVHLVITAPL